MSILRIGKSGFARLGLVIALGLIAPRAWGQVPNPEQIGKAIDVQIGKLRAAIASGKQEKVRAYLDEFYPMLANEKAAQLQVYVQGARGQQAKAGRGSAGKKAFLSSLMETSGYSGYVADGLNMATLGNIAALGGTLDGTLNNLGNLGLLLGAYDCYTKFCAGELDDGTRSATMIAVYAKLASKYLGRYGNVLGAAANTGYNLGMCARKWAISDAEKTIYAAFDNYWRIRARDLKGWRAMWIEIWEKGGHAGVLDTLQADGFWKDDFAQAHLLTMKNQHALPTWKKNYKQLIGKRYFAEYVARILANHVKQLADAERDKIIADAQRFLEDFPKQKITIVTTFPTVDENGKRMVVDASRVVIGLYASKTKLVDLRYSRQQVAATVNLKNFYAAIGKAKGEFQVEAFWRRTTKSARKAPDTLPGEGFDPKTGLVRATVDPYAFNLLVRLRFEGPKGHGKDFKVGRQGDRASGWQNYAWLGPIEICFYPVPIPVRVLDEKGHPVKGALLRGPWNPATTDEKGLAEMLIPLTGKSFVSLRQEGRFTGDYLAITGAEAIGDPQRIRTIRMAKAPKVAPLDTLGAKDATKAADAALASFPAGKASFAKASSRLRKTADVVKIATVNAQNIWGAHKAAQQIAIARKYADKPSSSQAQAAYAALEKKRAPYFQTFAVAAAHQQQTAGKLTAKGSNVSQQIDAGHRGAFAAAKTLGATLGATRERLNRLEILIVRGANWAQPRRFRTLAEVQTNRREMAREIAEAETLGRKIATDLEQIETQSGALKNQLSGALELRTSAPGLRETWTFESQMGSALHKAAAVARAAEGAISGDQAPIAAEMLRWADSLFGGVQIRAAQDQKLMNEYDALAKAAPMKLPAPGQVVRDIDATRKLFGAVTTARAAAQRRGRLRYARRMSRENAKKAWEQYGHNGFGVDAYEKWLAAEKAWASQKTTLDLAKNYDAIQKWYDGLAALAGKCAGRLASMRKSGWSVAEMEAALGKRAGLPKAAGHLNVASYKALMLTKVRDEQEAAMKRNLLKALRPDFRFDSLLPSSRRHAKLIASALAAALAGNLAKAEADKKAANDVIQPFCSQKREPEWELLCFLDALRNQDMLNTLLQQLHVANRATLTVVVSNPDKADLSRLTIRAVNAAGRDWYRKRGTGARAVFECDPGTFTVSVAGPGVKVTPPSKTVTLGDADKQTVTMVARTLLGGGGTTVTGTGKYYFDKATVRTIDGTTADDSYPPIWSADSKYLITRGRGGPIRRDIRDGKAALIITADPDPVNGRKFRYPRGCERHRALGKNVIYRNVLGSGYVYMTVPVAGGKPGWLCQGPSGNQRGDDIMLLIGTKAGPQPQLLFFKKQREVKGWNQRAQAGLYVVKGAVPDINKGQWLTTLPLATHAVTAVSADWTVVACPHAGPRGYSWGIYRVAGAPGGKAALIGTIPLSESIPWLALSPCGKYIAAVKRARELELVVMPVTNLKKQTVLASGAIAYGTPGWSPDGRFIAMRVFREEDEEASKGSRLLIVQVAGKTVKGSGKTGGNTGGGKTGGGKTGTGTGTTKDTTREAYQTYIKAYNRLTKLMAAGKGDTPEARKAYAEYKKAKDVYEKYEKARRQK